ncbi:trypsin alpha-3-like [Penaeus indicus]|uniref:trypsin alpha-3-like n=1 Tax=Penaeus indicus TaxID=29960 RepID=UPI00300DB910
MRTLKECLVLALVLSGAWGGVPREARIVGGQRSDWGEFPMMVAVLTRPLFGTSELICGGTIINDNHVLTSASCVMDHTALGLKVMAAGLDLLGSAGYEEFKNIQHVFIHESYDNITKANDIAILRTSHNFVFVTGLIDPAVLPEDDLEPASGSFASVAGWGMDKYEGSTTQEQRTVNGTYLNSSECAAIFGQAITPEKSCFQGDVGAGVCDGDEGGPILVDGVQVALVSQNVGCQAYPAIVTRLGPFLEWIKDHFEA